MAEELAEGTLWAVEELGKDDRIHADWEESDADGDDDDGDDDGDDDDNNDDGGTTDNAAGNNKSLKRKEKFQKLKEAVKRAKKDNGDGDDTAAPGKSPAAMLETLLRTWPPASSSSSSSSAAKFTPAHFFALPSTTPQQSAKNACRFVAHIAAALPGHKKLLQSKDGDEHGAPTVLVVCASAHRAADVINSMSQLLKAKVAKLFAKHFKLEEQVEVLGKQAFKVAVGTPNRLLKLVEYGALTLGKARVVLIDEHVDEKHFTVWSMPGVKDDFYRFLDTCVAPELAHLTLSLVAGTLRRSNGGGGGAAAASSSSAAAAAAHGKKANRGKAAANGKSRFKKAAFVNKKRKGF